MTTYSDVVKVFDANKGRISVDTSALKPADVLKVFMLFSKVKVCVTCKGRGCRNCDRTGIKEGDLNVIETLVKDNFPKFEKRLITAVNAKQRLIDTKAKKQQDFRDRVQALKEECQLRSIPDETTRKRFVEALQADDSLIVKSIKSQWEYYGKVTQKQIDLVFQREEKANWLDSASMLFNEYEVGKTFNFRAKVVSIEKEVPVQAFNGGTTLTNVVRLKLTTQQKIKLTSSRDLLISKFENSDGWVKFSATVKWMADNNSALSVSAKGLKFL